MAISEWGAVSVVVPEGSAPPGVLAPSEWGAQNAVIPEGSGTAPGGSSSWGSVTVTVPAGVAIPSEGGRGEVVVFRLGSWIEVEPVYWDGQRWN